MRYGQVPQHVRQHLQERRAGGLVEVDEGQAQRVRLVQPGDDEDDGVRHAMRGGRALRVPGAPVIVFGQRFGKRRLKNIPYVSPGEPLKVTLTPR